MAYKAEVIDHYENPRNVGKFNPDEPYVGTGMVGAPACGDVMRLQIKINPETKIIEEAKFQTFGCMAAIASSSHATEEMKNKTIDEALREVTNQKIAEALSLPPAKIHCSVLAAEAIRSAIKNYYDLYEEGAQSEEKA